MKLGSPPPPPPDDEAADPLLAALRQRLGDYGQVPLPGAWAAIRQQIRPAALPRPWWRRPGRLLPIVGLLLGWLAPGMLGEPLQKTDLSNWLAGDNLSTSHKLATQPYAHRPTAAASGELAALNHGPSAALATTGQPLAPHHAPSGAGAGQRTALRVATVPAAPIHPLASKATPAAARRRGAQAVPPTAELSTVASPVLAARHTRHAQRTSARVASADNNRQVSAEKKQIGSPSASASTALPLTAASRPPATMAAAAAIPSRRRARNGVAASRRAAATASAGSVAAYRRAAAPGLAAKGETAARVGLAGRHHARQSASSLPVPAATPEAAYSPAGTAAFGTARPRAGRTFFSLSLLEPVDSLALKQSHLLLASAPPAVLAARPDSNALAPSPVRRWSLLLVAGPTLSYRTLGPAPTLAARHPDFARLERPALGLGAQVQVRRVLSGRWALAVGVGYQEYATRLALVLKDSATSVHQRDTYRLLTVPVQFTYALGAPRGRLTLGLLFGAEPGWYVGGRSTEGSDCGCKQQVYPADSAKTSPYRSWNLAFSLGLDLRYRVGGPASRWQWVVQPTGRYVATPFVRSDAVGFTRRQPWSLGLMTGFSWDVR